MVEGNERPGAVMDTKGGNSAFPPSLLLLFLGGVAVTPRCTHTAAVKAGRGPGPFRRSGSGGRGGGSGRGAMSTGRSEDVVATTTRFPIPVES